MATRYLKQYSMVLLGLLVASLAINLLVNPFGLFPAPALAGFNAEKTEVHKHTRMIKAHAVRLQNPRGIILGTSRAEYGLDPRHPAWSPEARPVYNLALPSGRMQEALLYLQHAQAQAVAQPVESRPPGCCLVPYNMNYFANRVYAQLDIGHHFNTLFAAFPGYLDILVTH